MLKLVADLTPEAQEQLVEQMKLQWLRRAIDEADESLARGDVASVEELDEHIAEINVSAADKDGFRKAETEGYDPAQAFNDRP